MVTIIRPGLTKFTGHCSHCGCVFSYQLEDIGCFVIPKLPCPTCGTDYYHPSQASYEQSLNSISTTDSTKCQEGVTVGC